MRLALTIIALAATLSACVLHEEFRPTHPNGCWVTDRDYIYTDFYCRSYNVSYVFCDPRGRHSRPGCWYPDEVREAIHGHCDSYNICY